jgi:hypothetical protein
MLTHLPCRVRAPTKANADPSSFAMSLRPPKQTPNLPPLRHAPFSLSRSFSPSLLRSPRPSFKLDVAMAGRELLLAATLRSSIANSVFGPAMPRTRSLSPQQRSPPWLPCPPPLCALLRPSPIGGQIAVVDLVPSQAPPRLRPCTIMLARPALATDVHLHRRSSPDVGPS